MREWYYFYHPVLIYYSGDRVVRLTRSLRMLIGWRLSRTEPAQIVNLSIVRERRKAAGTWRPEESLTRIVERAKMDKEKRKKDERRRWNDRVKTTENLEPRK